jgi:hypothetical protein
MIWGNFKLTIEIVKLICLTLEMFNFKVNVFCRVNLVLVFKQHY